MEGRCHADADADGARRRPEATDARTWPLSVLRLQTGAQTRITGWHERASPLGVLLGLIGSQVIGQLTADPCHEWFNARRTNAVILAHSLSSNHGNRELERDHVPAALSQSVCVS